MVRLRPSLLGNWGRAFAKRGCHCLRANHSDSEMEIRSDRLAKDCRRHAEVDWTARPAEDGAGR